MSVTYVKFDSFHIGSTAVQLKKARLAQP